MSMRSVSAICRQTATFKTLVMYRITAEKMQLGMRRSRGQARNLEVLKRKAVRRM